MRQDNLQRQPRNKRSTHKPLPPLEPAVMGAVEKATPLRSYGGMTEDEKQLLSRCFNSDKASWNQFVQRYAGLIYHTIRRTLVLQSILTPEVLAEDLFQEVFLSLVKDDFAQLRRFRGDRGCTLASWLRMIAARRTIDQLRKLNNPVSPFEESPPNGIAAESEDERSDDQLQLLATAMAKLKPRERIIINLFFCQNLSAQDAASMLHVSAGAVYTKKSRILAKLRETLKNSGSL